MSGLGDLHAKLYRDYCIVIFLYIVEQHGVIPAVIQNEVVINTPVITK